MQILLSPPHPAQPRAEIPFPLFPRYDSCSMTKDGHSTGWLYAFDAENRLTLATGPTNSSYCYIYDGLGLRVAKKSGTASDCSGGSFVKLYWRSIAGDALTETDGTGNVTTNYTEYVFFAGRRIASRVTGSNSSNTAIFYYFADQLGSTRTITTGSGKNNDGSSQTPGQLCYDADFTPYGQEISYTQSGHLQATACPPNYKFTGYERDSETGLDYAFARYYSSTLGRFLSTDPLGGSIGDLQSHNAYAYTVNNPMNLIDPSGMGNHYTGSTCVNPIARSTGKCGPMPSGSCDWIGSPLCGVQGWYSGMEFELLMLAFTSTGQVANPDWMTTGCIEYFDCGNIPPFLDVFGNLGTLSLFGNQGGTPYTGGGSPYRLVLMADCLDASGRWRDYQAALPNNASGPVPPLTVGENLIGTNKTPTTDWGNNVGDHLRPNAILPSSENYQQSFYAKTSGGAWRPIAVSINGQNFAALTISETNTGQAINVLVNGRPAPMQMKTGNCPNNPGDQP